MLAFKGYFEGSPPWFEECDFDLEDPLVHQLGSSSSTCAFFKVRGRNLEQEREDFCQIKVYDKVVEMACRGNSTGVGSKWAKLLGADCSIQPTLKEKLD